MHVFRTRRLVSVESEYVRCLHRQDREEPPREKCLPERNIFPMSVAPSEYLGKLEKGTDKTPAIEPKRLDGFLASHLIDPLLLRSDDFEAFMADRQKRLLALIQTATGKAAYTGSVAEEGEDVEFDPDTIEAEKTVAFA